MFVQCPDASELPSQCAAGYWSAGGAAKCSFCSPGYFCPPGSTTPSQISSIVAAGTYYDPVANGAVVLQCPAGTYGTSAGGTSLEDACFPCPAGYYCLTGATAATYVVCPSGAYCPDGTSSPSQFLCPAGSYFSGTGATSEAECVTCPAVSRCALSPMSGLAS